MSRNPIYIKMINSARWKRLRADKLCSNALCEVCHKERRSTIATEVHHVVPCESQATERGIESLMFDQSNLQSLCHPCHAEIHRQMFSQSKESIQANNKRSTERFIDKYLL